MTSRDRWEWDASTVKPFPCATCAHRNTVTLYPVTCAAFPGGVPVAILRGEHLHRTPFDGDRGIQYTPLPEYLPKSEQMPR